MHAQVESAPALQPRRIYDGCTHRFETVPAPGAPRMLVPRAVTALAVDSFRETGRIHRRLFTTPLIGDRRIGVVTRNALVRDLPPEILVVWPIVAGAHRPLAAAFAVPSKG